MLSQDFQGLDLYPVDAICVDLVGTLAADLEDGSDKMKGIAFDGVHEQDLFFPLH